MAATFYDLQQYTAGDTWEGISVITILRNNSALDLTGAYAEMNVRFQIDAPLVVQFNTNVTTPFLSAGYGKMTILSPASAGLIQVPTQIVDIPPANYIYSIKVRLATGEFDTFAVGNWPVVASA